MLLKIVAEWEKFVSAVQERSEYYPRQEDCEQDAEWAIPAVPGGCKQGHCLFRTGGHCRRVSSPGDLQEDDVLALLAENADVADGFLTEVQRDVEHLSARPVDQLPVHVCFHVADVEDAGEEVGH